MVQWLRLQAFTAEVMGLILVRELRSYILCIQKKKRKKKKKEKTKSREL